MVTKAKKALLASLAAFLCVMLTVFGLSMSVSLSETAKAADETAVNAINLDAFVKNLENAGYNYDGKGVTVKWSPVSGCYDTREGHTCTVNNVKATANTPKRVNSGLTQFQLFEGTDVDVTVKNVNFVYEPAAFTVCENSDWKDSFTAEQAPAGQLYFMTTGSVAFEGCTFYKTVLTTFNTTSTSSVKNCTFTNVYNSYAVKDIRGENVAVEGCTFENCGAAIMVSSTGKVQNVSLTGNTFKDVDVAGTAPAAKVGTRGLIQIAAKGDYSAATISASGNTATNCGPVVRQLNNTVKVDETLKSDLKKLSTNGSSLYTSDSKKYVVKVGNTEYNTLDAAFAVLSSENYTLALLDESVWDAATPVYWKAGTQSGYVAKLTDALTAAYKANAGDIVIVCRPGADVGTMTHGHVADNLTIYGNNAYISGGECDLEVDTYMYSRATGKQVQEGGAYLEKNITINAYELDNLSVWGQRNTAYTVNVNLTDCDGKEIAGNNNVQRVYISGTAGVNNLTIQKCDFLTKATSIYSNADGEIVVNQCTFTGSQVPLNINHKADGAVTLKVTSSTFTSCGDAGEWKKFAAPARFVNSGSGTMTVTATELTFIETVGKNGDILLGDGREGQKSNDVTLKVTSTAANIQAQKPGYYNDDGTTNETKGGTLVAVATESYTTTVEDLAPLTDYVVVGGIAGFEGKKFASFEEAYNAIKPTIEKLGGLVEGSASATAFDAIFTDRDENGNAKLTYTIKGNVVYDETGLSYLLTMGRKASHYGNDRHLIKFAFVGVTADKKDTLTVNSNITLPYEWWGEKITTSISFENLTITGSAPNGLYPSQAFFEGIDFTVNNCTLNGIKIYNCSNVGGSYTITNSVLDGTDAPANAYAIHLQGNETAPLTINISGNTISGYDRGVNIDQATANATISNNAISVKDAKRSCIQLTRLAETTIADNNLNLTGGNAITLHSNLAEGSKITVQANTIAGNGYLIYDDTQKAIDLTYGANTVAATVDMTKGVYGNTTKDLSDDVYNEVHHVLAEANGVKFATLQAAIDAAKDGETVKLLADATEDVVVDKNITLDLGSKTLTGTNSGKATLSIQNGATTTIKHGIIVGSTSYYTIEITKGSNATATFEDLTATAGNTGSSMIDNWGTLTINSGVYSGGLNVVKSEEGSVLTISGGTFKRNSAPRFGVTGTILVYGTTTITGGEFIDNTSSTNARVLVTGVVKGYTAITKISGGKFTNKKADIFHWSSPATPDNFEISGGIFNKSIPYYICADGFIPAKNTDGTYGVKPGKYVADVEGDGYETLAKAIAAAEDDDTVTLLDNISGNFEIASAKNITLDLNGFTLNGETGTAKATITNYGTLTITDSSAKKTGTIKRDDNGIVGETSYYVIRNLGTMTIEQANVVNNSGYRKTNPSGSMIGSSLICNGDNDEGASLTINGGKLTQLNFLAVKNGANGTLVVNGGEITSNHSAIQNWFNAELTGGTIRGQLWTDAWKEGESVGNTVIGGNVDYEGEIVMDVTGSTKPELTINGGNLSVTNWRITTACAKLGGKPAISGGTFSSEVKKDYLANGFRLTKTGESYGVTAKYIESTHVSLGTALSFSYKLRVLNEGETIKNAKALYRTVRGNLVEINMTLDDNGYYVFDGITPQMLDRKISVNVYIGDTVVYDVVDYSILDYLQDLLKTDLGTKATVTKQLVADLAFYGKAAMKYVGYTTTVVDEFIANNGLTQSTGEMTGVAISSGTEKVANVSVRFASQNKILIGVAESVINDHSYTIKVNGTEIDKALWQTDVVDGYRVYVSDGFAASHITDENHYVEVEVLKNGASVQKVRCNIAGYCMKMAENAKMSELAKATYYYGVSAAEYANFKG